MIEEWKDIPGWSDRYQVSDMGRVRSKNLILIRRNGRQYSVKSCILKQYEAKDGRFFVRLHTDSRGKTYRVSKLVMLAFTGKPKEGQVACHGSNGLKDNSLSNLRYDTRTGNNLDCYRDGTMTDAKKVRRSDGQEYMSLNLAAKDMKVTVSSIWCALNGRSKTCRGFTWEYVV